MKAKIGVSLRPEFIPFLDKLQHELDFLEILPEIHMRPGQENVLEKVNLPLYAHSTSLSLGGSPAVHKPYLLKSFLDRHQIKFFSDHLSLSQGGGWSTQNFFPLIYDDCGLDQAITNLVFWQKKLKRKILLENITSYFQFDACYSEVEFFSQLCRLADTGILLDVNNLYINAHNFQFDPYRYISALPSERIIGLHVAGFERQGGVYYDTHMSNVSKEVLSLAKFALKNSAADFVALERDNASANWHILFKEIQALRRL